MTDTKDMPTEQGSRIYKGSRPGVDAAVVGLLRAAGASILGKTVSPPYPPFFVQVVIVVLI
jgi:amidase